MAHVVKHTNNAQSTASLEIPAPARRHRLGQPGEPDADGDQVGYALLGPALHVAVGEANLALVNMDGHVVAIGDLCLRCGSPLSTAALAGAQLTCSRCGWQYDVEQGCVVGLPALAIERHEVRVDGGHLYVAVAALESPASMP